MIDGLLMLSRNQRSEPAIAPVNVEELLEEIISKTRQTEHQAPDLLIEMDAIPVILTDKGLIEQVLQNLLSNAIKYSSNRAKAVVRINYYLQEGHAQPRRFHRSRWKIRQRRHLHHPFTGEGGRQLVLLKHKLSEQLLA